MNIDLYTRPQKPLRISYVEKPEYIKPEKVEIVEPIYVDKATQCHVTPDEVADRMVEYLGPQGDVRTLEPSGGTGALIRALYRAGHSQFEMVVVERNIQLARKLDSEPLYCNTWQMCFLEYAQQAQNQIEIPRVIMNPPFDRVKAHIEAAMSLMGRNGHQERPCLVALVPITYHHPDAETMEELPNTTFSTCKVNTKIIRIYTD
ncbi:MAG: methyltransferase type 11 [Robiginitomaculum sp.]|nr:MAG: methyltransferase type 11 [Robiginitomaculum sp.]